SWFAIAAVVWFGGHQVLARMHLIEAGAGESAVKGLAQIGVLVGFMQYAQRFFRPIQDLSEKYNIWQSAMAASKRVFKLLDTEPEIQQPAVTKRPEGPGQIEFDHVWF